MNSNIIVDILIEVPKKGLAVQNADLIKVEKCQSLKTGQSHVAKFRKLLGNSAL